MHGSLAGHRRARPRRRSIQRIGPGTCRVHGGQQHLHRQDKSDNTEQCVRQGHEYPGTILTPPTPRERQASDEDSQPQVLLDEDNRCQPRHAGTPPPLDESNACDGQQRDGNTDLVKLGTDRALQTPPQPVRQTNEHGTTAPEEPLRQTRNRQDRRRNQQVLDDQEGDRRREETIDRPKQCQDRMEVISQQVIARGLDRDDRNLEARVRLDGLGENRQIPRGVRERAPLRQ